MKKLIALLLVAVLVIAMPLAIMASDFSTNPNLGGPGHPSLTTDCGIEICIGHRADQGQWLRAQYDGETVYYRMTAGNNGFGTFNFTVEFFGRELVVYVQGNTLRHVRCAIDGTKPCPPTRTYVLDEIVVVRELTSANIGVTLFQVNRNHPHPVPLHYFGDRNGNVNFAGIEGGGTIEITTTRIYRVVYVYPNGYEREAGTVTTVTVTEDTFSLVQTFVPYDAGTTSVVIDSIDYFSLVLYVRGNTTLLDTSTVVFVGDANVPADFDLALNGSWYRVMSGDQG